MTLTDSGIVLEQTTEKVRPFPLMARLNHHTCVCIRLNWPGPKITKKKILAIEAPKALREVGCGEHWVSGLGIGGWAPSPEIFLILYLKRRLLVHSRRYFVQFSYTFSR